MEREPIIWRPNAISPEDWAAKSRDEQMAWWREHSTRDTSSSKRSMLDVPALYENGTVTRTECFVLICKRATDDETPRFLEECPNDIYVFLKAELEKYVGNDPKNWPRTFFMGSFGPWTTPEEIEDLRHQEQQAIWNGVEVLKRHLG